MNNLLKSMLAASVIGINPVAYAAESVVVIEDQSALQVSADIGAQAVQAAINSATVIPSTGIGSSILVFVGLVGAAYAAHKLAYQLKTK